MLANPNKPGIQRPKSPGPVHAPIIIDLCAMLAAMLLDDRNQGFPEAGIPGCNCLQVANAGVIAAVRWMGVVKADSVAEDLLPIEHGVTVYGYLGAVTPPVSPFTRNVKPTVTPSNQQAGRFCK